MITDLIAAPIDAAEAILATPGHANIWPTLEGRQLSTLQLAALSLALAGQPRTEAGVLASAGAFRALAGGHDGDPGLAALPTALSDALAGLQDEQVDAVAAAWVAGDPAAWDHAVEAQDLLRELAAFAASARAQQHDLLLWACP